MKLADVVGDLQASKREYGAVGVDEAVQDFRGADVDKNAAHLLRQAAHAGLDGDELMKVGEDAMNAVLGQHARLWYLGQLNAATSAAMFASAFIEGIVIGALYMTHQRPLRGEEELREDPRVPAGGWFDSHHGLLVRVLGIDEGGKVVYMEPESASPGAREREERHTIECFLKNHTRADDVPVLGGDER